MPAMGTTTNTPFGHHHLPTHGVQSYDMSANKTRHSTHLLRGDHPVRGQ